MKKYLTLIIGIILILGALTLLSSYRESQSTQSFSNVSKVQITIGTTSISADIAQTSEEREKGLGGREILSNTEGMLFVFEKPDLYAFWMKDMSFPIDIMWLDEKFSIVDVAERVDPSSFPQAFKPRDTARYVLEVQSGFFEAHGLRRGSILGIEIP